jgi:hypothetical protein
MFISIVLTLPIALSAFKVIAKAIASTIYITYTITVAVALV